MLSVENVFFKYRGAEQYALHAASCSVGPFGFLAIVGPSSVGKSTLMAVIAGIYAAGDEIVDHLSGKITLGGLAPANLRGPRVASWLPQRPALLAHLNVVQNVMLPLKITGTANEDEEYCEALMGSLDMRHYRWLRPRELSGGMQTRVALARALVTKPKHLFLDEPFVGLDIGSRWKLYGVLQKHRATPGLCTMMTTHNLPEALLLADKIMIMKKPGGATTFEVYQNVTSELESSDMRGCFAAARGKAPEVEEMIYGRC